MKKMSLKLKEVYMMAQMLNSEVKEVSAVMNCKNGSRMTSTLYILHTQEAPVLNISNCSTYMFDTVEEMDSYIAKKFQVYESDKQMYQEFVGMDDETWEEWNK